MSGVRIKNLQSANPVIDEKFDEFEFVVDAPDPDATLKVSGQALKKALGVQRHIHPIEEVDGLPGELDKKFDKKGGTVSGHTRVVGNLRAQSITVEEYLEVPELKYNRITATGNEVWVTDSGVIDDTWEDIDGTHIVVLKAKEGEQTINFQFKDILKGIFYSRNPDGSSAGFTTAYFEVTGVFDDVTFGCIPLNGIPPERFMTLARQGNKSDERRQGSVYLDGLNKTIRVLDGVMDDRVDVRNVKVQLGDLSDIDHPVFGQLRGYGALLENAYICGRIVQRDPQTGKDWAVGTVAVHGEQVFHYDENDAVTPEQIVITATENGFTSTPDERSWEFKQGTGWVPIVDEKGLSLTVPHDAPYWNGRKTLTIRFVSRNMYEDCITITKLRNGAIGKDGQTSYLHVRYSNDGGISFTGNNGKDPGDWIGQYVDFTEQDSDTPADYTWIKIKGERGDNGINGTNGVDGSSQYFHVRYSTKANGNPMTTTPAIYIGTCVTTSPTAPTNYALYTWSRFEGTKGEDGIPGVNGSDGRTSYLHIKYSNDGGTTFTTNTGETPGAWIGQYVDFIQADSNDPAVYTWTKIKGEPGIDGINGTNGVDGTSQYFHVRYSANANGNPMKTTPDDYIGTCVNSSKTAPTGYSSYTWVRFKGMDGEKGIPGVNGSNGRTSYLHIKYSNNGGVTFTDSNGEMPGDWIGQYVDFVETDSNIPSRYSWTKLKGDKGDQGEIGENITGRMMFRDPEFRLGFNNVTRYGSNGTVTRIARPSDCPTTSTHCLQIQTTAVSSPGLGGFYQAIQSRANGVFIQKFIAKLPVGYSFGRASNSMGTGYVDKFLTPTAGTGKYETYIRKITCGTSGSFSTGGHIYAAKDLQPESYPVTWYLASCTAYDQTDTEKYDDAIADAKKAIMYQGVFSSTKVYYNTTNRRDCVKYGSSYYMYKGTNGVSGPWVSSNWESFGAEFTSVATGLLLAELAYIENLGVKNLRTAESGTRVEITQAKNSMAFYSGTTTTPVLEIKTTSDPIYMGQGSGIQAKTGKANISIMNGYLHQGSEGAGVSVPVILIGQPDTISQLTILQNYTNTSSGKYKCGIYLDIDGTQSTASTADKIFGMFVRTGGIFVAGDYGKLRSNNVLSGIVAAGQVSKTGSLLRSWTIALMGGYITTTRQSEGRYRVTFSNTSYLSGGYNVLFMVDGPHASGKHGAYACTMARTSSYFDVWTADDASTNDCGFTFIIVLTSKFW